MLKLPCCTRLMASLCAVAVVGVVSLGCGSRRAPMHGAPAMAGPLLIQIDSAVYTARRVDGFLNIDLGATLTNQSNEPIYFVCDPPRHPSIRKKDKDRWVVAYSSIYGGCSEGPFVLAPGQSYYYHYPLQAILPPRETIPRFETTVPGTYRFQWSSAYVSWGARDTISGLRTAMPESLLVSNDFELVEE